MNTIAEVESVVTQFSLEELVELEQFIRHTRREKERAKKPSLREITPANVGSVLQPIGTREQWYEEIWEGR